MVRPKSPGFTLVELVLVLVVVGVIAAVAAPRFFDLRAFQQRGFFDVASSAVRFAQKYAVATGCNVRVQFSAAGVALTANANWAACQGTSFGSPVPDPAGGAAFNDPAPAGVAVGAAVFYFDAAGRPHNSSGNLLSTPIDVTIGAQTLRIEPESGYAYSP